MSDRRSRAIALLADLDARANLASDAGDESGAAHDNATSISPIGPIVLGVGGASVIAGIVIGALAFAQGQDELGTCPTQVGCPDSLRSRESETHTLAAASDALWITGAVVAVTGLVLTLALRDDASTENGALELRGTPGGVLAQLRWRLP